MKMLKRVGIPVVALMGMMALWAPAQASAAPRFEGRNGGVVYAVPVVRYVQHYRRVPVERNRHERFDRGVRDWR